LFLNIFITFDVINQIPVITMNEPEPVYSQAVLDMFTVANEYCIFVEKAGGYGKADIYNYFQKVLPLLYIKGALIPFIVVEYPEANERYLTEEQWQHVLHVLRNKFDEDDTFSFSDPNPDDASASLRSLAENLADIYQDMKDFVLLYSRDQHAARENAVHEIGRLYKSHWGHRALMCLTHLHYLLHRTDIEAEDIF
jgi:hypothetical protein